MKNILKIFTVIAAFLAILAIIKLASEALGLGTHKYFNVDE